MDDDSSSSISTAITKEETMKRLKEDLIKLFKQLRTGCYRNTCYNIYCNKNPKCSLSKTDKELLTECIKLVQLPNYKSLFCYINDDIKSIESYLDSFTKNNLEDNINIIDSNNMNNIDGSNVSFPKPNLNFEKIKLSFKSHEENNEFFEKQLAQINNLFFNLYVSSNFSEELDEKEMSIVFYLYTYQIKALFYVLCNQNLSLSEENVSEFDLFFSNYREIKSMVKKCLKSFGTEAVNKAFIKSFEEIKDNINTFTEIITNCQTFLTMILIQCYIKDEEDDNDDQSQEDNEPKFNMNMKKLLINFVKTFKLFHRINEAYSLISYKEFYNEGVSKSLNIKRECEVYNTILKKKLENKEKPFCLFNYIWLFDPASKSEIFRVFNTHKQSTEIFNSLHSLEEGGRLGMPLVNASSIFLVLKIRRNHLIEDTLNAVSISTINLQKPLKVKFENEQGVDEGGVRKEFFMLLVRQIFDPNFGMFSYNEKHHFFWFNLYSFEPKIKYELIGILLGLALFNDVILDIKFPLVIYKKLLDQPLNLEDMKACDPDLYQTLSYLKNTTDENLKETISMNFTVTVDKFGEKIEIPLKPKGDEIYIDNDNREEYIQLYLDWYFNKSIEEYFLYFKNGFYRACNRDLAKLLKEEELELIICGTQKLDFKELEKATRYDDGYTESSVTCKYFWEVLHTFTEEEKKKFLFFLTGCDRAPINGLRYLPITISRYGPDSDKLPCAHTCFNHLLLPDYSNKEKLRKLLLIAINNSEGFGMI